MDSDQLTSCEIVVTGAPVSKRKCTHEAPKGSYSDLNIQSGNDMDGRSNIPYRLPSY